MSLRTPVHPITVIDRYGHFETSARGKEKREQQKDNLKRNWMKRWLTENPERSIVVRVVKWHQGVC